MFKTIRIVARCATPSPYSNHVLIEPTSSGTFRASGVSNRGGQHLEHFAPPECRSLREAMSLAWRWARPQAIDTVHVAERMLPVHGPWPCRHHRVAGMLAPLPSGRPLGTHGLTAIHVTAPVRHTPVTSPP